VLLHTSEPGCGGTAGCSQIVIDKYADLVPINIADAYALEKQPDKVFEWLDRAVAARNDGTSSLLIDQILKPYRNDPRFVALCRTVGLLAPTVVAKPCPESPPSSPG
jgi:hypothetical protein